MTFFSKNLNISKAVKNIFCICLTQSLTKNARSAQKKSIFLTIFAWKNWFSQETQAIWKKLKQLLGKTQENIQKLKQNEHQVLSCSQKKCKIKTPGLALVVICLPHFMCHITFFYLDTIFVQSLSRAGNQTWSAVGQTSFASTSTDPYQYIAQNY